MRRERRLPWWLMYATVAVLSERTSTCVSCSSVLKRRRASHTASNSRQLICHCSWGPVQSPATACPLHMAPQPVAEASVETTTCLDTCSRGSVAEQNKKETKDSPPGPPPGEGVVRSPSPEEQNPKAPGRPSQGRRLPWRSTGLAGAEAGCAGLLRPAPRCGRSAGCCCGRAGAEVEAAGGRPRRRADGGAAAGGGVETAADRRGRM